MNHRFRPSRRRSVPLWMIGICGTVAIVAMFELYQWIVPFHTANPLWHEVTIGEPVIDAWQYGGKDEEGYLKFFIPGSSPVLLPPSSHLFDADGKFVVIEAATDSTLTFAEPYEAISMPWLIGGLLAISAVLTGAILVARRHRRSKGLRTVPSPKRPRIIVARVKVPFKVRRWLKRQHPR